MNTASVFEKVRISLNRPVFRCLGLVILLTSTARIIPINDSVLDPDLWWHLRDGDWIVAHHMVPHQGVFSQYGQLPWIAYSWGFEVILSRFYHWFGLMGFVIMRAGLEAIITSLIFLILWRGIRDFWKAWLLTAVGIWAIHHCLSLQPMLFSILLFTIELGLIWDARREKNIRLLFLLPVLFVFWANLHIQFVYGLFVLLLLTAVGVVRSVLPEKWSLKLALELEHDLPLPKLLAVSGLSVLATFMGPYSWRLYAVILSYVRSSVPYNLIIELQAPNFRVIAHYVMVLILAAAFFTLGWRRSRDVFQLLLLSICTILAFRMTRDAWFGCLPALAIIADRPVRNAGEEIPSPIQKWALLAATAVVAIPVFMLIMWDSNVNNRSLAEAVAKSYPAGACNFIRAQSLPRPIYNDLGWGGFIIFNLPDYPVAIDGRTDLYGDDIVNRFIHEQWGPPNWIDDPDLGAAKTILLNPISRLSLLMKNDQHFSLVYEDRVAEVFVRNDTAPPSEAKMPHR